MNRLFEYLKSIRFFTKVLIILGISTFILSFVSIFIWGNPLTKNIIYESMDSKKLQVEKRYIPSSVENKLTWYVNELILGPFSERNKLLFPHGTKVLSCFVSEGVLYLDLSEEALLQAGISSETKTGCELLVKNIKRNFSNIKQVNVFMMGNEVYKTDTEKPMEYKKTVDKTESTVYLINTRLHQNT